MMVGGFLALQNQPLSWGQVPGTLRSQTRIFSSQIWGSRGGLVAVSSARGWSWWVAAVSLCGSRVEAAD